MAINPDEQVPVRSFFDPRELAEDTKYTKDEEQQTTLQSVYKILKDGVVGLDKWSAFDLTESELKLKQQIKAHKIAADILTPALEAVEQALIRVDDNFRRRNSK